MVSATLVVLGGARAAVSWVPLAAVGDHQRIRRWHVGCGHATPAGHEHQAKGTGTRENDRAAILCRVRRLYPREGSQPPQQAHSKLFHHVDERRLVNDLARVSLPSNDLLNGLS